MVGIGSTTRMQWARFLGAAYVELFRNIPLLVQMFLWYFVVPEILPASLGAMIKQIPPPWGIFVTAVVRSEEHTSEIQSLMRNAYAVLCLKQKKQDDKDEQYLHYKS